MKKFLLSGLLLTSTFCCFAQSKADSASTALGHSGNNEIKINLLMSILGLPEINYERIIEDNMSVGLAAFVGVNNNDLDYNFGFIPNYRLYFGGKKASGFFIEGNMALVSVKDYSRYYYSDNGYGSFNKENKLNFGLGAAAGAKFLTKNGFLGEVYLGLGRFLGQNRSVEAYPRIGITLGKRF